MSLSAEEHTCFHEAAHAVVDHCQGAFVEYIEIGPEPYQSDGLSAGRVKVWPLESSSAEEAMRSIAAGCAWDIAKSGVDSEQAFNEAVGDFNALESTLATKYARPLEEGELANAFVRGVQLATAFFNHPNVAAAVHEVGERLFQRLENGRAYMDGTEFASIVGGHIKFAS